MTTLPPPPRDISQDISLLSEYLENTPNKVKAAFKVVENFIKNNKESISLNNNNNIYTLILPSSNTGNLV